MALKFGRTSGITSRIDPNGKKKYTEEELDAYNMAVAAENERKSAYDVSKAKFKAESDVYYGRNIVDQKKSAEAAALVNKAGSKDVQGRTVTGEVAKPMTQAQSDKLFDERRRKGETISINDPSVTDKTRSMLKEAYYGTDISNASIRKGKNYTKWSELYGEDFDPVKFRKDARANKMDNYPVGRSYGIVEDATLGIRGVTPVDPGDYVPANLGEKINPKDVDWKPVKPMDSRPKLIDQKKYGKLRPAKEEEAPTWGAPSLDKRKKATHMRATKIYPSETTKGGRYKEGRLGIHNAAIIKQSDALRPQRIKYNTEKRQSAAYYGNETVTGEKITGKTESQLRSLKQEVKGDVKRMKGEGRTQDARDVRGDLPQIRKAIRYAKKADLGVGSVTGLTMEGDKSTLRYFTPERTKLVMNGDGKKTREEGAMAGYKDVQRYNNNKAMEQTFKGQADNAANKNTIANQQAKLTTNTVTPSYKSQMRTQIATENPTATKREVKKLAQTKQKTDEAIMQAVDAKMKAKGLLPK